MTVPRWKATIEYRLTHDTRRVEVLEFDEFDELDAYVESGPNFHAIDKITIIGNLPGLATTIVEEMINNGEVIPDTINPADIPHMER